MKLTWKTCLKVGISLFVLYLCIYYWGAISGLLQTLVGASAPLIAGGAIAYVINILMSAYERNFFPKSRKKFVSKIRRPLCMLGAILSLAAIITLIVWLVLPQLASCVQLLWKQIPDFLEAMVEKIKDLGIFGSETIRALENINWPDRLGELAKVVTSGLGSMAEVLFSAVSSVLSWVVATVLSVIFAIYLLLSKDRLKRQYRALTERYLKEKWRRRVNYVFGVTDDCFHRYIVGQCTEALVLGLLCMVGMWALRLPYPTMIGALIAFTALIPVAGAFIGGAIGAFMIFMVNPMQALIFLIFLIILQQVEGNIIYPKVVGDSIGLPAIWVLAAVTIGGGMLGVGGMLLGVPLAAVIYRIIRDDLRRKSIPKKEE